MPETTRRNETEARDALDHNQPRSNQSPSHQAEVREHHLDKTIEDSFPASDPPSTDPAPGGDE